MIPLYNLYSGTNDGLDILVRCLAIPEVSIQNPKKAFKLRDEKTPSAYLYPPDSRRAFWHVVDYGGEGRIITPIDAYRRMHNIPKEDFALAVAACAKEFGIVEELSKSVNRADYIERDACEDEKEGDIVFKTNDDFTDAEVRIWGKNVTHDNLTELGWQSVEYYGRVKEGKVKEWHSNEQFPIFIQTCHYLDKDLKERIFHKFYKPNETNKAFRFFTDGEKPLDYIFGLEALIKKYHQNDDKKLKAVVIVSGGSDAVNCLSMGYQPVWLNSETADFTPAQYNKLKEYAEEVYSIPDIDSTGIKEGKKLALRYIDIKTIWLPSDKMSQFNDNRGRALKDLKDYLRLYPSRLAFQRLVDKARPAKFWDWADANGKGEPKKPFISLSKICYFLGLNNFYCLEDDGPHGPRFVHIERNIIEEVTVSQICHFIRDWMEDHGLSDAVIDKTMRSHDVRADNLANNLKVIRPETTSATATSQWFYCANCAVEVTAEGITRHNYASLPNEHYIWKDSIIQHDYKEYAKMFDITRNDDGTFNIDILSSESEVFCFYINASRNYWRKEMEEPFIDNPEDAEAYMAAHRFCIKGEGLSQDEIQEQIQSLVNKIFTTGYLLHKFKTMSRAWGVILYDQHISETNECNGRSGKSLYGKLLRAPLDIFEVDASNPRIVDRQFLFAGVTKRTDTVFLDECSRFLDFNRFFGKITDGFTVEQKGVDSFTIDFKESPKMMFATNHVIPNQDSSSIARQLPVVFSDYYHQRSKNNDYRENRSVHDDFGHDIGVDGYNGWGADIAFYTQCEQFYLSTISNGEKILPSMGNIEMRQAKQLLGENFESWASDYLCEGSEHLDVALDETSVYSDYYKEVGPRLAVSQKDFRKKVRDYCYIADHIDCFNPMDITNGQKDGERWRKTVNGQKVHYYWIRSKKALTPTTPTNVQTELEFDATEPSADATVNYPLNDIDIDRLREIGNSNEPF